MIAEIDALLRSERRYSISSTATPWLTLVVVAIAGSGFYGCVMGFYGLRPLQATYSMLKVPLLLGVASTVCLPSFFVINTALGLRNDFPAALRGVLVSGSTLAITLAALAPITVFFYFSVGDYATVQLFNGLQFFIATLAAQKTLAIHYAPLIRNNRRHRVGKTAWLCVYVFVAVQMAWVLRPFIGAPQMETRFLREDAWTNAYVFIARRISQVLFGIE